MRLNLLFCAAVVALSSPVYADVASHRQTAAEVLNLINGPAALRAGISTALNGMIENLRREGTPDGAIREFRAAVEEWVEKELVWDEIRPRMIDLYVREFSEAELRELLAFYKTPVGAKALERFPTIFAEAAKIGQEYAQKKQASLNERLEKIADKYQAERKAGAADGHQH